MSKVIGIEEIHFTGKNGDEVHGKRVHFTDNIDADRGVGEAADKVFLSAAKLAALDFAPAVGQDIDILYDRYGRVKAIRVVEDDII